MPRRTWTDKVVASFQPKAKVYVQPDPALPGFYVRVQPGGSKSFVAMTRDPNGKQKWVTVGPTSLHTLDEARDLARAIVKAVKAGEDHSAAVTFGKACEDWFARKGKTLRSAQNIRRRLDAQILPAWGGRDLASISRGDVTKLLDTIEDERGPVAADSALTVMQSVFTWYESRSDGFASPIRKGMRRTSIKARARKRILSDDELRAVWAQAEANGTFGALVRLLLLTGQRRDKVATMRWQDVTGGAWTISTAAGEKGNAVELVLSEAAVAIIEAQPRFAGNDHVFAGRVRHFNGFSKSKLVFDAKLLVAGHDLPPWTLHDLRRTAKSLMARAGIRPDISERVLGHSIAGVEGTYDRHSYCGEKAHALRALAGLIETILRPASNVVPLMVGAR